MDEIETRLAAVELVAIELTPWIEPQAVEDALASIRTGLDGAGREEREIRLQAVQLLTEGRDRFRAPDLGVWIRSGD